MKKSIIIACSMLLAVSCNLLDDDDDDNNNPPPPSEDADVAVVDLSAPESVEAGTIATITATLENITDEAVSDNITVILSNQTSETNLDTVVVEGLAANAAENLTFEWNTTGTDAGDYTISVSHNLNDENAANNEATANVTVMEGDGSINDLAISNVTAPDSAEIGSVVDIELTVENLGDSTITDDITVTLTETASGEIIGTEIISGFETGTLSMVTFTWNTGTLEAGEYTLNASHDFADDNTTNDSIDVVIVLEESDVEEINDLAISEVNAPGTVTAGEDAQIDVTLANAGTEPITEDIMVTLTDNEGAEIASEVLSGVETEEVVSFTWSTEGVAPGDYDLTVAFDYVDDDETNNMQTFTITVEEDSTSEVNFDLDITAVDAPSNVTRGDTAFIEVTIENIGTEDATADIPVLILHHNDDQGSGTINGGLAAGESVTIVLEWLTANQSTGAPPHPLDITIDIEDANIENNVETVGIQVDPDEGT